MLGAKEVLIYFGIYSVVVALSGGFFFLLMKIENDLLDVICIIGYVCLMGFVGHISGVMRRHK